MFCSVSTGSPLFCNVCIGLICLDTLRLSFRKVAMCWWYMLCNSMIRYIHKSQICCAGFHRWHTGDCRLYVNICTLFQLSAGYAVSAVGFDRRWIGSSLCYVWALYVSDKGFTNYACRFRVDPAGFMLACLLRWICYLLVVYLLTYVLYI